MIDILEIQPWCSVKIFELLQATRNPNEDRIYVTTKKNWTTVHNQKTNRKENKWEARFAKKIDLNIEKNY